MPTAIESSRAFWRGLGANVEIMTPEHHDLVLAVTSHLPHLIAYTIVGTADELRRRDVVGSDEILRRRLSRLHPHRGVRSDDVARRVPDNKDAVLEMLGDIPGGSVEAHPRHPPRRRRSAVRPFHPHPRHPPRHRRDRPGRSRTRFRTQASATGEEGRRSKRHHPGSAQAALPSRLSAPRRRRRSVAECRFGDQRRLADQISCSCQRCRRHYPTDQPSTHLGCSSRTAGCWCRQPP